MLIYSHMYMKEINSKSISPSTLAGCLMTGNELELLDVRTGPEFAHAHLPGARSVPLHELRIDAYLAEHKAGTPIYVICQAGSRAAQAIAQFEKAGCHDCVLLEGGTEAWINAGLPVHRGKQSMLPIMRQVQITVGALSLVGAILALAVNRWFVLLPLLLGCGLLFAGITGTCGLALLLARMPWNHTVANCKTCCSEVG